MRWEEIGNEEYHAHEAWGHSSARMFEVSPKAALAHKQLTPSSALVVGTLVHAMVLEPDNMPEILECPTKGYDTRAAQALREERPGALLVNEADMAEARALADAITSHDDARSLLFECPRREISTFWEQDGIQCKARPDAMSETIMLDLKTARDFDSFRRVYLSSYTVTPARGLTQAGWYTSHPDLHHIRFGFILAVKEPAIDVGVIWLSPDAVKHGRLWCSEIRHAIANVTKHEAPAVPWWAQAPQVYDPTDGLAPDLSITVGGVPIGEAF